MAIRKDLTAKRFFHLVVWRQSDSRRDSGSVKIRTVWRCLCDCGNETDVLSDNLVKGNTKSCGCRKVMGASSKLGHEALSEAANKAMTRPVDGHRKYTCNDDFFVNIDTEQKAYWLGFITADGCVMGNKMQINLAASDVAHLEKLRLHMGATNPVTLGTTKASGKVYNRASFVVTSETLVNGLRLHGVSERKSLNSSPASIPARLVRHYWRGVVDGDGSIPQSGDSPRISLVGSRDMVSGFCNFAALVCGSEATPSPSGRVFQCSIKHRKAGLLLRVLYDGALVYLDRKMSLYTSITSGH